MNYIKNVYDLTEDLQDKYKTLSEFEALQIACKMQQNRVIMDAFMVKLDGKDPVALEGIAMALGLTANNGGVRSTLGDSISQAINNLSEVIDQKEDTGDSAVSFALNSIAKAIEEHGEK